MIKPQHNYTEGDHAFIMANYQKGMKSQDIAAHIGVSNTAIWAKIDHMRENGFDLPRRVKEIGETKSVMRNGIMIEMLKLEDGTWKRLTPRKKRESNIVKKVVAPKERKPKTAKEPLRKTTTESVRGKQYEARQSGKPKVQNGGNPDKFKIPPPPAGKVLTLVSRSPKTWRYV